MSKIKKYVRDYMIAKPLGAQSSESLKEGRDKMQKVGARHLPVFRGEELLGVVSDRDIALAMGFRRTTLASLTLEDVCTDAPFITTPDANLKRVAFEMAQRKIGSAIVMEAEEVVGIFTTTDACVALSELLAD